MHIWKHFSTITRHRHKVIVHCFMAGIFWQGLRHDLSKYSPAEFIPGARNYLGDKSPNEKERERYGFSRAWLHHQGRNKHHFEYWIDISKETKRYVFIKMPYRYLAEMVCDRIAASKTYKGKDYTDDCALQYFLDGQGRSQMHPDTARELEKLLTMLKEKGEKAAFSYIKSQVKEKKKRPFDY